jgi:hypothetical protein
MPTPPANPGSASAAPGRTTASYRWCRRRK